MKKQKYTTEDLLKRIENLEKVVYVLEMQRVYPNFIGQPTQLLHYHNGVICYQNPCVWC